MYAIDVPHIYHVQKYEVYNSIWNTAYMATPYQSRQCVDLVSIKLMLPTIVYTKSYHTIKKPRGKKFITWYEIIAWITLEMFEDLVTSHHLLIKHY